MEIANLQNIIIDKINNNIVCESIEIIDETKKHEKHKHFQKSKYHLRLKIISKDLSCMKKLEAHKAIYESMGSLMQTHIHALAIEIIK